MTFPLFGFQALLIETAVGAAEGMPVCVGVSHPGTAATAALAVMARDLGAAAVMVTPSLEPTPATPAKIGEYFGAVAAAAPELQIVLQDHPASTKVRRSSLSRVNERRWPYISIALLALGQPHACHLSGSDGRGMRTCTHMRQCVCANPQVHMSLSLIADICEELEQVKCVKLESTPTPARTAELITMLEGRLNRPRPTILTGLGGLYGA
jgi:hypothetical protein